jgi:hypothetical protein
MSTPTIQHQAPGVMQVTAQVVVAASIGSDGIEVVSVQGQLPATAEGYRMHRAITLVAAILREARDPAFLDAIEQLVSELPAMFREVRQRRSNTCNCEKCRRARGESQQPIASTTTTH